MGWSPVQFLYGEKLRLIMLSDDITSGSSAWCFSLYVDPQCCWCWAWSVFENSFPEALFFPLPQAHIQWSQITLCEGTCNKHKGRNWCSCQLSVLRLGPADMKGKHFVTSELSKQVWASVHWAENLATEVLYCRHVVLPPLGKF